MLVELVERPRLALVPELPLRPRIAYLPYPSCPVPAAGPFLADFSAAVTSIGDFVRLEKKPNRPVDLEEPALCGLGSFEDLVPTLVSTDGDGRLRNDVV